MNRSDVEAMKEEAFERGLKAVRYIRCTKHRSIPQYNKHEVDGAECPACEVEPLKAQLQAQAERIKALEGFVLMVRDTSYSGAGEYRDAGYVLAGLKDQARALLEPSPSTSEAPANG